LARQKVEKYLISIEEEKEKLKQQIEIYKKELGLYQKEKTKMNVENKGYKENLSIKEDSFLEYQAMNYRQAQKIKKLKDKIQVLKGYIA